MLLLYLSIIHLLHFLTLLTVVATIRLYNRLEIEWFSLSLIREWDTDKIIESTLISTSNYHLDCFHPLISGRIILKNGSTMDRMDCWLDGWMDAKIIFSLMRVVFIVIGLPVTSDQIRTFNMKQTWCAWCMMQDAIIMNDEHDRSMAVWQVWDEIITAFIFPPFSFSHCSHSRCCCCCVWIANWWCWLCESRIVILAHDFLYINWIFTSLIFSSAQSFGWLQKDARSVWPLLVISDYDHIDDSGWSKLSQLSQCNESEND